MKRYIDLFRQQANQNEYLSYIVKAKKIGIIIFIVLLVVTVIEFGVFLYISRAIAAKEDATKRYNSFIIQNQVFDSKLNYFTYKYSLLKQYLADDANVDHYYGLLRAFLSEISSPAIVLKFSLTNEQIVTFNLGFTKYEDAFSFMSRFVTL